MSNIDEARIETIKNKAKNISYTGLVASVFAIVASLILLSLGHKTESLVSIFLSIPIMTVTCAILYIYYYSLTAEEKSALRESEPKQITITGASMKPNIDLAYSVNTRDKATIEKQRIEALEFNNDQFFKALLAGARKMAAWNLFPAFLAFIFAVLFVPTKMSTLDTWIFFICIAGIITAMFTVMDYFKHNKLRQVKEKAINDFFDNIEPDESAEETI